jgi:uncharacterized protein
LLLDTITDPRIVRLAQLAQGILERNPACHDWDHTLRVWANARRIREIEGGDALVVDCAAILHDVGRPEELADQGVTCHAQRGAELARELLPAAGLTNPETVEHVAACVLTHRFRARNGDRPETLEARIIFDADKLDSIGAIGIGRSFHFAGRIGARVHNSAAAAQGSDSYSREDSAYREYLVKLRHVRQRLLTDAGRQLAAGRHRFMVSFFEEIEREVRGEDLLASPPESENPGSGLL